MDVAPNIGLDKNVTAEVEITDEGYEFDMFWNVDWKREMTSYIAKDDNLHAFKCNGYGLIDFIVNRSVSQWIVPAMYRELLKYELNNSF